MGWDAATKPDGSNAAWTVENPPQVQGEWQGGCKTGGGRGVGEASGGEVGWQGGEGGGELKKGRVRGAGGGEGDTG